MYSSDPEYGGAPPRALPSWHVPESWALPMHRRDTGLGFLFAAPLTTAGVSIGSSLVGSILADTPDHDPAKLRAWAQQVAATGAGICAAGKASRDVAPNLHAPGDPGFRKGETIRFELPEVIEAVRWIPEGRDGDAPSAATYGGLRRAVYEPSLTDGESKRVDFRPLLVDRDSTARLAVGVAHGRIDCGVGWQEEPAVVHLRKIVEAYRNRPTGPAGVIVGAVTHATEAVSTQVQPLVASLLPRTEDGKAAAVFLGLLAVGALGAMLRARL
jgi:hypothetical protein